MPARTNPFQRLIVLIQHALKEKNATITESAMEIPGLGRAREIDVMVSTSAGEVKTKFAIEAKAETRKMDMVKAEAILGKYCTKGGVTVDKLVVVSSSGFTADVPARFAMNGIKAITLSKVTAEQIAEIVWSPPRATTTTSEVVVREVWIDFAAPAIPPGTRSKQERVFCQCATCKNKDIGSVSDVVNRLVRDRFSKTPAFRVSLKELLSGKTPSICCKFQPKTYRLCVEGTLYEVERLHFHLHCKQMVTEIPLQGYLMSAPGDAVTAVHHGSIDKCNQRTEYLFTQSTNKMTMFTQFTPLVKKEITKKANRKRNGGEEES